MMRKGPGRKRRSGISAAEGYWRSVVGEALAERLVLNAGILLDEEDGEVGIGAGSVRFVVRLCLTTRQRHGEQTKAFSFKRTWDVLRYGFQFRELEQALLKAGFHCPKLDSSLENSDLSKENALRIVSSWFVNVLALWQRGDKWANLTSFLFRRKWSAEKVAVVAKTMEWFVFDQQIGPMHNSFHSLFIGDGGCRFASALTRVRRLKAENRRDSELFLAIRKLQLLKEHEENQAFWELYYEKQNAGSSNDDDDFDNEGEDGGFREYEEDYRRHKLSSDADRSSEGDELSSHSTTSSSTISFGRKAMADLSVHRKKQLTASIDVAPTPAGSFRESTGVLWMRQAFTSVRALSPSGGGGSHEHSNHGTSPGTKAQHSKRGVGKSGVNEVMQPQQEQHSDLWTQYSKRLKKIRERRGASGILGRTRRSASMGIFPLPRDRNQMMMLMIHPDTDNKTNNDEHIRIPESNVVPEQDQQAHPAPPDVTQLLSTFTRTESLVMSRRPSDASRCSAGGDRASTLFRRASEASTFSCGSDMFHLRFSKQNTSSSSIPMEDLGYFDFDLDDDDSYLEDEDYDEELEMIYDERQEFAALEEDRAATMMDEQLEDELLQYDDVIGRTIHYELVQPEDPSEGNQYALFNATVEYGPFSNTTACPPDSVHANRNCWSPISVPDTPAEKHGFMTKSQKYTGNVLDQAVSCIIKTMTQP